MEVWDYVLFGQEKETGCQLNVCLDECVLEVTDIRRGEVGLVPSYNSFCGSWLSAL